MIKTKKKSNPRVMKFEHHLLFIASKMSMLSDDFIKLKEFYDAMSNIKDKRGIDNLEIFFASFGKLNRKMNEFKEDVSNYSGLTKENINPLKELEL